MGVTAMIAVLIVIALGFDRHLDVYRSCELLIIVGAVGKIAGQRIYGARGEHEDEPRPVTTLTSDKTFDPGEV
jgi:hypothetical protein